MLKYELLIRAFESYLLTYRCTTDRQTDALEIIYHAASVFCPTNEDTIMRFSTSGRQIILVSE